ncbi:HNH endonuclease signature motif containing protein [Nonomuraea sp. NPDC026600]|uniref:HNH endonuclease n=1 Tax=Nonomuraea sp. NPDC026600 TaxID=3155363 RepID=UPI0033FC57F5
MERDSGVCYVCRRSNATEVDHILCIAEGGSWELDNLAAICAEDHKAKSFRERRASRTRRTSRG